MQRGLAGKGLTRLGRFRRERRVRNAATLGLFVLGPVLAGLTYVVLGALDQAKAHKGRPTFIIANTVKGKGVSFMENQIGWHGMAPNKEQTEKALAELRAHAPGGKA